MLPRTVVVVTSPGGAAIRDIVRVLSRRETPVSLRIIPVPVQGDEAHIPIANAIRYAGEHNLGETIVVTRGGGSLEDLLPFSEESVVQAINASPIPVVSAVGHEIDWALSDYAADARAPTPSAAAEIVAPALDDIRARIRSAFSVGASLHLSRVRSLRYRLRRFSEKEIRYRFRNFAQPWYQRLDEARISIEEGMHALLIDRRNRIGLMRERIEGASPYLALKRGYAIVRDESTGAIVTRKRQAIPIGEFSVEFDDGSIRLTSGKEER